MTASQQQHRGAAATPAAAEHHRDMQQGAQQAALHVQHGTSFSNSSGLPEGTGPGGTAAVRTPAVPTVTSSDYVPSLKSPPFMQMLVVRVSVAAAVRGARPLCMPCPALQRKGLAAHKPVGTHKLGAAYSNVARLSLRTVMAVMFLAGLANCLNKLDCSRFCHDLPSAIDSC